MKKLLLLLLCVPLIFSCGENPKSKKGNTEEEENVQKEEIENELIILEPNSPSFDTHLISVSINKDIHFYVNEKRVDTSNLEQEIIEIANEIEEPEIILYVDRSAAVEHAVKVLEIAYRNKFKIVLAKE